MFAFRPGKFHAKAKTQVLEQARLTISIARAIEIGQPITIWTNDSESHRCRIGTKSEPNPNRLGSSNRNRSSYPNCSGNLQRQRQQTEQTRDVQKACESKKSDENSVNESKISLGVERKMKILFKTSNANVLKVQIWGLDKHVQASSEDSGVDPRWSIHTAYYMYHTN